MAVDKNALLKSTLAATLATVGESAAYTDLKQEYDDGIIEREEYFRLRGQLDKEYLPLAFSFASTVAMDDPYKEEKSLIERDTLQMQKEILEEQRPLQLSILQCENDTKCLEKSIIETERSVKLNTLNAQLVYAQNQSLTEVERKKLLTKQRIGFDDNVTIERYKASAEVIGMIMSGGNDAPQELWDNLNNAISRINIIESHHEEG